MVKALGNAVVPSGCHESKRISFACAPSTVQQETPGVTVCVAVVLSASAMERESNSRSNSTPGDATWVENKSRLSNRSGSPVKNVSASGEPAEPTKTLAASTQRQREL